MLGLSQSCGPMFAHGIPSMAKARRKRRLGRQHLEAALTANRLGHREYEPDKQKPDENANPQRARRAVLGPRHTRPEPRLRESIGGLTKDRVTGLDNPALSIQDLIKRTRVGSRTVILAWSEHGTSKPNRRESGIFLGTRGPVFKKGGYPLQKADSPATRESMHQQREWWWSAQRVRGVERRGERQDCPRLMRHATDNHHREDQCAACEQPQRDRTRREAL